MSNIRQEMNAPKRNVIDEESKISGRRAFRIISLASLAIGILTAFLPTLVYIAEGYEFSFFTTYLSDMGATPVWPQVLFNTGTLLAAPLRMLVIILLGFQLYHMGATKRNCWGICIIGFVSTIGTILMTAVPYTVNLNMHKAGIGLYFLGIVFLQSLIGVTEWKIPELSRIMPILSWLMVVFYFIFVGFVVAFESGQVPRSAPVVWEWLCYFCSMSWLAAHSYILGKA